MLNGKCYLNSDIILDQLSFSKMNKYDICMCLVQIL